MAGDGSKSNPWQTLSKVFDVRNKLFANAPATFIAGSGIIKPNPRAPIVSGDIIYLMSGEHGSVTIQGAFGQSKGPRLYGYDNAEFITIAAAPGETPIIKSLSIKGANKWLFSNLTFQSLQDVPSNLGQPFRSNSKTSDYFLVSLTGPNSNIILTSNTFMSQANVDGWTKNDWLQKRASGVVSIGGECLSYVGNYLKNIGFALGTQRSRRVLLARNKIDMFSDDGIDYGSSELVIEDNIITNSIDDGDGFHQDGIQGQPFGQDPVENVVINGNTVINQTRDLLFPANLQGIDEFDGVWRNVVITNNVVATNAYHGISYFGVSGLKIENNTVIGTNPRIPTWIMVGRSKDKRNSSDVIVTNNIATAFSISPDYHFDHNMMASLDSKTVKRFKPNSHVFADNEPMSIFVKYNISFHSFDLHLSLSRAIGSGDDRFAPLFDRDMRPRKAPVDLGAYVYRR